MMRLSNRLQRGALVLGLVITVVVAAVGVAEPAEASSSYDSPTVHMYNPNLGECLALQGTSQHNRPFLYTCGYADQLYTFTYYGVGGDHKNYFWIKNNHNGLCLAPSSTILGSPVWSATCGTNWSTLWHIESASGVESQLRNRLSDLCFDRDDLIMVDCPPAGEIIDYVQWELALPDANPASYPYAWPWDGFPFPSA